MDLVAVTGCPGASVVPDRQRQEVEHQVRIRDLVVAPRKTATLEMVRGAGPAPEEQPLGADERPPPFLRGGRLHRDRLETPVLDVDLEVVLQIRAHAWQVRHDRDPERREVRRLPDPRQLQKLRRVDGAARKDDLAAFDPLRSAAAALDVDGAPPPALEDDARDERPRSNGEVAAAADRL